MIINDNQACLKDRFHPWFSSVALWSFLRHGGRQMLIQENSDTLEIQNSESQEIYV